MKMLVWSHSMLGAISVDSPVRVPTAKVGVPQMTGSSSAPPGSPLPDPGPLRIEPGEELMLNLIAADPRCVICRAGYRREHEHTASPAVRVGYDDGGD
jgi:hypothetical protein